jgi:ubiquinone/menaquinone biosynthesis C-methylase UbiE
MREIAQAKGFDFEAGSKVLEFGCSHGRMIRWLHDVADKCEIWGVDIMAHEVAWCQQHLSPPFQFATTTTLPHLPFEDRYFDFIYAGSVFTHIADLAEAWLLELKRVLVPGGKLYVTVHDNHSVDILFKRHPHNPLTEMLRGFEQKEQARASDFQMLTVMRTPAAAQVFYDIDFLCRHWGRYLHILSVTQEAYADFQTAILFEK